ncbi:unnamed protein product [Didymodactylos carnosus]|uniref:Innexin n=1 Tax=Didymodactylos carnosus TaxID=1234261 RepID=A0A814JYH3_9BILA|nr:unnamed protein product [Didymodactylos carnosus]CAF3813756.1 unnamed protein product [Didymodactylos carnosus]
MNVVSFARDLPWIQSLSKPNDDQHVDRLNHRYTVGIILVFGMIVTGGHFMSNRVTCWVPAQFKGSYAEYTNNYCWISNTYYIHVNNTIPDSEYVRGKATIEYYNAFQLFLQHN